MVYTVTFNPSLDYIVSVDGFRPGRISRARTERILPGGKGVNVSAVLGNLGIGNTALGFAAGFTGNEIIRRMEEQGIKTDFIRLAEGHSRICLKLEPDDGTAVNGRGPDIRPYDTGRLMEKLDLLGSGDFLVLAGSVPDSVPDGIYRKIMEQLAGRGVETAVDASGSLLENALAGRPFLVKPNSSELGEIFHTKPETREEAVPYALKMQEMGAANVLVSMAGEGAVLAAADGSIYSAAAPGGRLVNSVGAGDSMVAGFLAGWLEKKDYGHAFRMGVCAGSASAFSGYLAGRQEIEAVLRRMDGVQKIQ